MSVVLSVVLVVAIVLVVLLGSSVRILKQYERAVKFRLGRVGDGAFGPGLILIVPLVDRVRRVSLRIVTMPIQSQGIITRDNVSVDVSAVAYFKVDDADTSWSTPACGTVLNRLGRPRGPDECVERVGITQVGRHD